MRVSFNADSAIAGLDALSDATYSVARTMGAAVGAAMRDEAKANVRSRTGNLARSIYVAFDTDDSTATNIRYSVSWNRKKLGQHGHLVEFGHWRTNVTVQLPSGQWITTKEKLDNPEWVPARPFLRPALYSVQPRAIKIAAEVGRKRLQEIMQGDKPNG